MTDAYVLFFVVLSSAECSQTTKKAADTVGALRPVDYAFVMSTNHRRTTSQCGHTAATGYDQPEFVSHIAYH